MAEKSLSHIYCINNSKIDAHSTFNTDVGVLEETSQVCFTISIMKVVKNNAREYIFVITGVCQCLRIDISVRISLF